MTNKRTTAASDRKAGKLAATVERLGRAIVSGQIPPGTRLDLPGLAPDLAPTTLHHVMARLAEHGLTRGMVAFGYVVRPVEQWHLTDAAVLGWLAASPDTPLGSHAADLARNLESIATLTPGNPLVAALARALGAKHPEGRSVNVQPSTALPFWLLYHVAADGTPVVEIETYPGPFHDVKGSPYLRVWVNESEEYSNSLPEPLITDAGVQLPTGGWIAARVTGHHAELSTQLKRALDMESTQWWVHHAGPRAAMWAAQYGGAMYNANTVDAPSALDEAVHVTVFTHPEHGRVAAVLRGAEDGRLTGAEAYLTEAGDATWGEFDAFDVVCDDGRVWHHRAGLVSAGKGESVPAGQLWPDGMVRASGSGRTWLVHCPDCDQPATVRSPLPEPPCGDAKRG